MKAKLRDLNGEITWAYRASPDSVQPGQSEAREASRDWIDNHEIKKGKKNEY